MKVDLYGIDMSVYRGNKMSKYFVKMSASPSSKIASLFVRIEVPRDISFINDIVPNPVHGISSILHYGFSDAIIEINIDVKLQSRLYVHHYRSHSSAPSSFF